MRMNALLPYALSLRPEPSSQRKKYFSSRTCTAKTLKPFGVFLLSRSCPFSVCLQFNNGQGGIDVSHDDRRESS